jgi:hypothetical protein
MSCLEKGKFLVLECSVNNKPADYCTKLVFLQFSQIIIWKVRMVDDHVLVKRGGVLEGSETRAGGRTHSTQYIL